MNPVTCSANNPDSASVRGSETAARNNACLTCPVFLTGPEFLPELREQRHRTLTLIDVSTSKGHTRVVEMNQQVLTNLDRMIGELDTGTEPTTDAG
jgi:hypothetical protein